MDIFALKGTFDCHNGGGGCYTHLVVDARDASKHPTLYRAVLAAKGCPAQNVTVPLLKNSDSDQEAHIHLYVSIVTVCI